MMRLPSSSMPSRSVTRRTFAQFRDFATNKPPEPPQIIINERPQMLVLRLPDPDQPKTHKSKWSEVERMKSVSCSAFY